jgi:hypothetical protein
MKSFMQISFFAAMIMALSIPELKAQAQPKNMDVVVENPNAEADKKVVADYYNALTSADTSKVKGLMAEKFMLYGPSAVDSSNAEKELLTWSKNYKTQLNRSVSFLTQSFKVPTGEFAGNWVCIWGKYKCTIHDIDISIPFQSTCKVENGKISKIHIYYDNLSVRNQLSHAVPTLKR